MTDLYFQMLEGQIEASTADYLEHARSEYQFDLDAALAKLEQHKADHPLAHTDPDHSLFMAGCFLRETCAVPMLREVAEDVMAVALGL